MITAVHKNTIDEFNDHFNKQNTSIRFTQESEEKGKIPFLDCLVTREKNTLRTTVHTHSQPTPRNVLQCYFTQSDYSMNLDEKSTHLLRLRRQFERRNQAFEYCFYLEQQLHRFRRSNVIRTPHGRTAQTTHTPPEPLNLTWEGRLKRWHAYYDLATYEMHTNPCSLYHAYSLKLSTKTNLKTD